LVPCIFAFAPKQISNGAESAAGKALQRLPAIVAILRIVGGPVFLAASATKGNFSLTISEFSISLRVANAPISKKPSFLQRMYLRLGIVLILIRYFGLISRFFHGN
jgi:hypothetical protein